MKQEFVSHTGQPRLLLIFAGWAMDANPFRHLHRHGYDIAVVWDYRTDSFDSSIYAGYSEIAVMAWSMGVWGATRVIPSSHLPVTLTIAVNGSTHPVSDTCGIPVEIFRHTLEGLNERSLLKFYRRVAGSSAAYSEFSRSLPQRPIDELRDELTAIERQGPAMSDMRWDQAVISTDDAIFPADNLRRQWNGLCNVTEIKAPHLPDWTQLTDRFLIDKSLVGMRFGKSAQTYTSEASVQLRIASHLWQLWQKHLNHARKPDTVIEIGYGTGAFTREYAPRLHPGTLSLWDLVEPTATTDLPGTKISCDAEIAIMEQPDESADAIVSASTIQWFNSTRGFLEQAFRVLRPDGILVLSTFGDKTYRELRSAGAASLPYVGLDTLRTYIPDGFITLEAHEGTITRNFSSPIDILRHIKATGVNALRRDASASQTRALLQNYPRSEHGFMLTYNPIYLILKKRQ